jgi:hypothetical protein
MVCADCKQKDRCGIPQAGLSKSVNEQKAKTQAVKADPKNTHLLLEHLFQGERDGTLTSEQFRQGMQVLLAQTNRQDLAELVNAYNESLGRKR